MQSYELVNFALLRIEFLKIKSQQVRLLRKVLNSFNTFSTPHCRRQSLSINCHGIALQNFYCVLHPFLSFMHEVVLLFFLTSLFSSLSVHWEDDLGGTESFLFSSSFCGYSDSEAT